MGKVVGIDLGTTNSVAAFKFAEIEIVTADDNTPPERRLTRSVVAQQGADGFIVGQRAYNQLRANPREVILSVKRLMGRGFADAAVQQQLAHCNYRITKPTQATDQSLSIWIGDQEYQPEDISAIVLKRVVQNAQAFQNDRGQVSEITDAVITIPAYFNDKQRNATRQAASRAGLRLQELLPEPTAAAISYGFMPDQKNEVRTILVYDFGGGTFDVSLLTTSGNQFIELGKAGDLWLGGDDIDQAIETFVQQQVAVQESLDFAAALAAMPLYQRIQLLADLKIAVEAAKITLTQAETAQIIPATPLLNEMGLPIMIDIEITRSQFEALVAPIVARTIPICYDAIRYGDHSPEDVDMVLLVGGSAQIPLVQQMVQAEFGVDRVVLHPRPMYAVAEGAAIVAAGLAEKVGTVSRDYYIKLADGDHKIISRSDVLPVCTSQIFRTVADGQSLIRLELFNRDDERQIMEPIGKMWLPIATTHPKGTEILVTLELDEQMSDLKIMAVLKNDPTVKVSSLFSRGGIDEKINDAIDTLIQEVNTRNLANSIVDDIRQQVSRLMTITNCMMDPETGTVREDLKEQAQEKLQHLENAVSEDYLWANHWMYECRYMADTYHFVIHPAQQERLRHISTNLLNAVNAKNVSGLQKLNAEAQQEYELLPEIAQQIQACRRAIDRASEQDRKRAQWIVDQKDRFVAALQQNDRTQADEQWRLMLPEIQYWLNQEVKTGYIQTELAK
jgi:molecular chaperone DnaK